MTMSRVARAGRRLGQVVTLSWAIGMSALVVLPVRQAMAQAHGDPHGAAPNPHGAPVPNPHGTPTRQPAADPHGAHQIAEHGDAQMGSAHEGGHHELQPINWINGLLGERENLTEESILFRKKGTPVPLLANVLNFGLVVGLLVAKAGPMVRQGLIDRREDLLRDSEAAAKALAEAQERYNAQQARLDRVEEEVARIKADYSEQGRLELERVEREGRERHERLVRDAHLLVEQEGRALHQRLLAQTVDAAARKAEEQLTAQLTANDQDRLAREFLGQLGSLNIKQGAA